MLSTTLQAFLLSNFLKIKKSIVCLGCDDGDLPQYTNAAVNATDSDTAPYYATEVVTYECNAAYSPNPQDAALECICTANQDNTTASWLYDPSGTDALSNTCVASK